MRSIVLLLLIAVAFVTSGIIKDDEFGKPTVKDNKNWEAIYKSQHATPKDLQRTKRLAQQKLLVESHNKKYFQGEKSFYLALNHIAHWSPQEYAALNGFIPHLKSSKGASFVAPSNTTVHDSIDWRNHGYVTEVKDQGYCGSCYAFSATGALEGQNKKVTGKLVSLSEQNLLDCSSDYGNDGCNGGAINNVYKYVKENGGIATEESYPYEAEKGECMFNKSMVGATDQGFVDLPHGDEEALKVAVATVGPISVAIDASHWSFQAYGGGVYYEEECRTLVLDHAVLVVGYGTDEKHGDFWIVKNSWGEDWGEEGYIRMARNRNNNCGIASRASFPIVTPKEKPTPPPPAKENTDALFSITTVDLLIGIFAAICVIVALALWIVMKRASYPAPMKIHIPSIHQDTDLLFENITV
uniref:Cathepsin L-like n=1 Tax=Steinernema glaseri TaxID=37863 RepID=A0A1I7YP27_9BILA